ncbi:MAG: glycosyltransferase, partial [Akkermansiaceae bacterium]|nr:glycosyltransferase [Akkermansiaceae bacterium]
MLEGRIRDAKREFDLTNPDDQVSVRELAEEILAEEPAAIAIDRESPIEARIAGLLAESRRWVLGADSPLKVGVVFAMWGEQNRLRPQSADNPHGENSLVTKLEQLDWLTEGSPIEWRLYAVDDGCPHGSAAIAAGIAQ